MEQLEPIIRAVCLGICVCGLGVGLIVAVFLGISGRGILSILKDIFGVGQRDEDELIDEAVSSIHQNRVALQKKRDRIVGDGGIPDFDAAVQKYAQKRDDDQPTFPEPDSGDRNPGMKRFGSSERFDEKSPGLRGKRFKRDDDYEIYDDGEFFD